MEKLKTIENLIKLNVIREIQLEMLKAQKKGFIISEEIINVILAKIEADNK